LLDKVNVRTGENRHEKQRENKPLEGSAEKEECEKEPAKIKRGEEVSIVILNGVFGSSEFLTIRCLVGVITSTQRSEGVKKLVFFVLGPFRMALFPELWDARHHRLGNASSQ